LNLAKVALKQHQVSTILLLEKRIEIIDAPLLLRRQDEVDMDVDTEIDVDLPETSVASTSMISTAASLSKTPKPKSVRKTKKPKSAPTSEVSPRRLRKTPARIKSNPATPALSRESSPVKDFVSPTRPEDSAVLQQNHSRPAMASNTSANTIIQKESRSPEPPISSRLLEEKETRSTRSTRSAKSKHVEPAESVWKKKTNTYSARLHPEPEQMTRSSSSLRKQVVTKAIKKKEIEPELEVSASVSTADSERPLTRARLRQLGRSETK
jgi:hypothetical protein